MTTTLYVLMFTAIGALLVFATYAGVVGIAGALGHARYLQCARCHHHYLASVRNPQAHECQSGITAHVEQVAWSWAHDSRATVSDDAHAARIR